MTFRCKECDKVYSTKVILNRHIMLKHQHSTINCELCDKKFLTRQSCNKHVSLAHKMNHKTYAETFKTEEWISCYVCGKNFYRAVAQQKCNDTNAIMATCSSQCMHIMLEEIKKKNRIKKGIKRKSDLYEFYCEICNKRFKKRKGLYYHLSKTHKDISREQYAFMFQTDEIIKCFICKKEVFRKKHHQVYDNDICVSTCCSNDCKTKVITLLKRMHGTDKIGGKKAIEKRRREGTLNESNKRAAKTKKENDLKDPTRVIIRNDSVREKNKCWREKNKDKWKQICKESGQRRKENGIAKEVGEKVSKWHKDNPEKKKISIEKAANTKMSRGSSKTGGQKLSQYWKNNQEKQKERDRKIKNTKENNNSYKTGGVKAGITNKLKNKLDPTRKFRLEVKRCNTIFEKTGKYPSWGNFSLLSQELFREIEKHLKGVECFYATKTNNTYSNEYRVFIAKDNTFSRFLDFYIPHIQTCIEFDEEYHENEKQRKLDEIRTKQIINKIPNIRILRIKEKEFLNNRAETIDKCLKFISDGV